MPDWSVPRCFDGGTVAVLASGESMSQAVADAVHRAGIPAIAINTTHRLAPWAWALYAADAEWWHHKKHRDAWEFGGLKVTIKQRGEKAPDRLLSLESSGIDGFDPDPRKLRTGGNGGYQAAHIAAHAGATRILLCGLDMHGGHWHGDHPDGLKANNERAFDRWVACFASLVKPMKARGIDVINVTPGSRLDCFRRSSLEAELSRSTADA